MTESITSSHSLDNSTLHQRDLQNSANRYHQSNNRRRNYQSNQANSQYIYPGYHNTQHQHSYQTSHDDYYSQLYNTPQFYSNQNYHPQQNRYYHRHNQNQQQQIQQQDNQQQNQQQDHQQQNPQQRHQYRHKQNQQQQIQQQDNQQQNQQQDHQQQNQQQRHQYRHKQNQKQDQQQLDQQQQSKQQDRQHQSQQQRYQHRHQQNQQQHQYERPRTQQRQQQQPKSQNQRINSSSSSARSRTEIENLRSALTDQLYKNKYECMICIMKIDREQEIWSCEICYKIFHLTCIKQWANSEESGADKNWRCPGCQYSYSGNPIYKCFCGKRPNPAFQPGEIPHSCGEKCHKKLNTKANDCNHHCSELCHPGPCPTCTTMTKRACLCGRESRTIICSSNTTIRCENVCGKLKSCRHHTCDLTCHPRACEPCDQLVTQICLSHGTEREVLCSIESGNTKTYNCGEICGKLLVCGNHQCTKTCHDGPCPDCTLLPEICKTCACGKTTIDNASRESCLDPLPTCDEVCDKMLSCGSREDHHRCLAKCHNDACPPCNKETLLQCRCGQTKTSMSCKEATEYDSIKNPYLCQRRCNKKKLCGKHRCNELCCDRDVHVCEIVCGKTLNCGVHTCEELCHKNTCRKCPINSYDELTCRCGQTTLQPPISCGTKPPTCNYVCNRTHACDHPTYHSCHNENECPPCTYLVSKLCVGKHMTRHNIPCHINEVACGQTCGKPLSCGVHTCQRSCHAGPCQTSDQNCMQKCPKKRRECDHPCNTLCHGQAPCPSTTCRETIKLKCPCGRLEKDVCCNIKPNEVKDDTNLAESLTQALSVRTIDLSLVRKQQPAYPKLECNDECQIIQRNRKLAQALSIDIEEQRQSSVAYTDFLRDYAKKNTEFVQTIERYFAQLVEETQRYRVSKRCHSFKPMKKNERHVIHELAEFYGLETQSMDPEPNRNVVAYASFGMCKLPSVTLSESVRREKFKIPPPVVSA